MPARVLLDIALFLLTPVGTGLALRFWASDLPRNQDDGEPGHHHAEQPDVDLAA
jgi:hypothetical protein